MSQAAVDESPWWMKYGARGVGCGGGIIAMGLGLLNCITFTAMCLVAGIWQIFAGFIVVSAEAPCCCMFIDFVQQYSAFVEARPSWQKGVFYLILSIPGPAMCQTASTFCGSALIFLCAVLYGMMSLGKKGSREDMIAKAQASGPAGSTNMKNNLVSMEAPTPTS